MINEKSIIYSLLIACMSIFFGFGLYHLALFDTTDEHLWKFERVPQYWQAINEQDWAKTYINDKPGVTVALISGIGLIFEPSPSRLFVYDHTNTDPHVFEKYDLQRILRVNYIFRLPVLIFATLSLLLFFWTIKKAFDSQWLAITSAILLAVNPILLGMSQIINPDSFFWIFGGLAMFSYIALLNTSQKKFIMLTGIYTGFALLSKYTATTLFIFYLLTLFFQLIFPSNNSLHVMPYIIFLKNIRDIAIIFFISIVVFSIFLPAVFIEPSYLTKGISQFISLKQFAIFLFICGSLSIFLLYNTKIYTATISWLQRKSSLILRFIVISFLFIILFTIINVFFQQKLIPFDALKDTAYANEPKEFNFNPLLKNDAKIVKKTKLFFMESYPIIYSLTPIILLCLFILSIYAIRQKTSPVTNRVMLSGFTFFILYFLLTVFAGVVTNVRYSIILYPLLTLVASLIVIEFSAILKHKQKNSFYYILLLILLQGCIILFIIKPFYFNYSNILLPSKFSIHDSWGHGSYEAAQYLNSLPNAENLVIWSNSKTVCMFFKGACLKYRKIDLSKVTPDYFVISRRGEIKFRNHFQLFNVPDPNKNGEYYFKNIHALEVWKIEINGHPDNYISIIPYEK